MGNKPFQNKLTAGATLSEIVAACSDADELLTAIGLKPAEYKDQSLRSVCQQLKWSENEVLRWLKRHCSSTNGQAKKEDSPKMIEDWGRYIKNEYHRKNREYIKAIEKDFPRVHQIHGNQYVWLKNMQWQFERLQEALQMYSRFEARKFYPLLSKMENAKGDLLYGSLKKVERGMEVIQKDQDRIHGFMKKLKVGSNNFDNPANACSTLRILNHNFKELFKNINEHFELEQEKVLPMVQKKMETVFK